MEFSDRIQQILDLQSAQSLLDWDQCTHMPTGGAEARARVMATLEGEIHRRTTDPRLGELAAQKTLSEDPLTKEIGEYWLSAYQEALKIPEKLAIALSEAGSKGYGAWVDAKNFKDVLPELETLVSLNREYASCFPEMAPYDALIDCFEPDITQDYIEKVFGQLKPKLLQLCSRTPAGAFRHDLDGEFERSLVDYCKSITASIGYDYKRGNFALTEHPFMASLNRNDARITTGLKLADPLYTVMSAIHEAGHAIYEQNAGYSDTGLGTLSSSALHESQSLFYETLLGKSSEFWTPRLSGFQSVLAPIFSKGNWQSLTVEELISRLRHYDPTNVVRLQAGDLDYGLHIMLRYELERDLFSGKLEARHMKDCFNALCVEYFGREPKNDRTEGVLQDVHWPAGLFGYFPSYLLGVIFSAQLWAGLPVEDRTDSTKILTYLGTHVHTHGGRYNFKEVSDMFGGLNPDVYVEHLASVYVPLKI